jgi:hypothetical protein
MRPGIQSSGGFWGLVCGSASIECNEHHSGVSYSSWVDDSSRKRPERHGRDAEIMTTMAGTEAELELLGKCCGADGNDRAEVERLLADDADAVKVEKRLRKMTKMLVKRHSANIKLIAETLAEVNTLSGRHIDEWWDVANSPEKCRT